VWLSSTLQCQCKLCGETSRPGIANGIGRAGKGARQAAVNWPRSLTVLLGWIDAELDITMPELAAKLKAEKDVTARPA
jgi:hypothetical protein